MNKIFTNKNLIIKAIGIAVVVVAIPMYLVVILALEGVVTLPEITTSAIPPNYYGSLYFTVAGINIVSIPLILIGYVKDYRFNWINHILFIGMTLNVLIAIASWGGIITGKFCILILLTLPAIIYIIGWLVHKNTKSPQNFEA